jgi:hypothetical protein
VCPYCGHDFRVAAAAPAKESLSAGMRILLYLVSIFIWIAGIIIGIIFLMKPDPEYKRVGKICLILGVVSILITVGLSVALYVMVLGFGTSADGGTPTASLTRTTSPDYVQFTFGAVSHVIDWSDVSIILSDGYDVAYWYPVSIDLAGDLLKVAEYGAESLSSIIVALAVTDLSGNGRVDAGDYFRLSPSPEFNSAATYTVTVVYEPTGGDLCSSSFAG